MSKLQTIKTTLESVVKSLQAIDETDSTSIVQGVDGSIGELLGVIDIINKGAKND